MCSSDLPPLPLSFSSPPSLSPFPSFFPSPLPSPRTGSLISGLARRPIYPVPCPLTSVWLPASQHAGAPAGCQGTGGAPRGAGGTLHSAGPSALELAALAFGSWASLGLWGGSASSPDPPGQYTWSLWTREGASREGGSRGCTWALLGVGCPESPSSAASWVCRPHWTAARPSLPPDVTCSGWEVWL